MNTSEKAPIPPHIQEVYDRVDKALRESALAAQKLARDTNTPLVVRETPACAAECQQPVSKPRP